MEAYVSVPSMLCWKNNWSQLPIGSGLQNRFYVKFYMYPRTVDAEVATMRLVRSCTSIPVPRVIFQFSWLWTRYFIMERLPGVPLDEVILSLPEADALRIQSQLRDYMQQLRSISRSSPVVSSVIGGPIFCTRMVEREELSGPFHDQAHLHLQLRREKPIEDFPESIQKLHNTTYPIVLTHNDFAAHNILVKHIPEVGWTVSAILDWEMAGWLPGYWEYVKSKNQASNAHYESQRLWNGTWLPRILEPCDFEASVDEELGFFGYPKKHIGLSHFVPV